jgi:hypothetical protein
MELYSKIRQFVDLQEIVEAETSKIFQPIIKAVQRRDKQDLLHSPITESPLSVKWVVFRPKGFFVSFFYYLVLKVEPSQETDELNLVLASRWDDIPQEVDLESEKKLTMNELLADTADLDEPGEDEPDKLYGLDNLELARFPLNGENNPAVVAKKILAEVRRILKTQKLPGAGRNHN